MPSKLSRECDFTQAKEAGLTLHRWPESEEEAKGAEEFLINELANLSLVDHERVLFDIYGIADSEQEDAEMIETKLNDLQSELDRIESKDDYNLALQMNPAYVEGRSFRLLFLRCEEFDANAAAKRMVAHFVEKRNLFGSGEVLGRDVTQSDLGESETAILRIGYIQVLPVRDASGRLIQFMTSRPTDLIDDGLDPLSECRAIWYHSMSLLRDGESYKGGTVNVLMNFDFRTMPVHTFATIARVESCIPSTVVAAHYCYSEPDLMPFVHAFRIMMPEFDRCRFRVHFGNRDDLHFKLQTHGIPTAAFPYKRDGSLLTENHLAWLEMLRIQEERTATMCKNPDNQEHDQVVEQEEGVIYIPGRFDVLFGKSVLARDHTGTRRALHVVDMYYEDYDRAQGKSKKIEIVKKIISIIHESGGRFLKSHHDGCWSEASEVDSKRKIAHWFRHSRSKRKTPQEDEPSKLATVGDTIDSDAPGVIPVQEEGKMPTAPPATGAGKRAVTMIAPIGEIDALEEEAANRYKKTVSPSPSDDDTVSQ